MMKIRMPKMNIRNMTIAVAVLFMAMYLKDHMKSASAAAAPAADAAAAEAVKAAMSAPAPMNGMNM